MSFLNELGEYNFLLAQKIDASENEKFDVLVPLANGGLTMARDMADALRNPRLSSMRIVSYKGLRHRVDGKRILLYDDVLDSGDTMEEAIKHVREMGAADIKVAVLGYKPRSKVKPDYYGFETNAWVVFPHEYNEFIRESTDIWKTNKVSPIDIRTRFLTIGVPANRVDYYSSLHVA